MLGKQSFFLGEKPSSLDASAYGILANIYFCLINSPLKEVAERYNNLKEYCKRIYNKYYVSNHPVAE